jgi:hypothetical protein
VGCSVLPPLNLTRREKWGWGCYCRVLMDYGFFPLGATAMALTTLAYPIQKGDTVLIHVRSHPPKRIHFFLKFNLFALDWIGLDGFYGNVGCCWRDRSGARENIKAFGRYCDWSYILRIESRYSQTGRYVNIFLYLLLMWIFI